MWRPSSYADVAAAVGVLAENAQLDFKRELSTKGDVKDLAKDAAAMSIEGGVIIVGMDETNGVASGLTPVPLRGTPERIQQVVDAHVRPPLTVEIETLRAQETDPDGIVVITVPASALAPHMYEYRFPARSGATTRSLEESEVTRLYERRAAALADADSAGGLNDFVLPPHADSGRVGIGRLRVVLRPLAPAPHPASPWLRRPLGQSVQRAESVVEPLVDVHLQPVAFSWLSNWVPRGSTGFWAGRAGRNFNELVETKYVAATFRHVGDFSFYSTVPLVMPGDVGRCAYEHLWAAELLADLAVAGQFFSEVPAASLLRCDLALEGLDGSVSWRVSQGTAISNDMVRVADTSYRAGGLFTAADLAADPRDAARELLDPFFASFMDDGWDVVGRLRTG